jgi:hypothetical protein
MAPAVGNKDAVADQRSLIIAASTDFCCRRGECG